MGNHDLKNIRQGYINRFEHVAMQMHIEVGKQKIYLNHYPFLCFDGGYKDVWQLFGHVHTRQNNTGIDAARLQYLYQHSTMSGLTTITSRRYHLNKSRE